MLYSLSLCKKFFYAAACSKSFPGASIFLSRDFRCAELWPPLILKKQICPKVMDFAFSVHFEVFLISDQTKYQHTRKQNVSQLKLDWNCIFLSFFPAYCNFKGIKRHKGAFVGRAVAFVCYFWGVAEKGTLHTAVKHCNTGFSIVQARLYVILRQLKSKHL